MPRPDLAKLIGENLGDLPQPGGRNIRLMHYSSFGQTPEIQKKVGDRAQKIGEAIVHLAERDGFRFSHVNDPKPIEQPGRKVAKAFCAHCGCEIFHLAVGDDLTAQLSAQAIRQFAKLVTECPHK